MQIFNENNYRSFVARITMLVGLVSLLLLTGCAGQYVRIQPAPGIGLNDYSTVSKALEADMPDCTHLRGIRFHTSFTSDLDHYRFLETKDAPSYRIISNINEKDMYPYFNRPMASLYQRDLAGDISALIGHILVSQCGAVIVDDPGSADVAVVGSIKKFHSQIIEKTDVVDDGWNRNGSSMHMKISSVFYVNSKVNGEDWTYEELLSIDHKNWLKADRSKNTILLGGVREEEFATDIKTYLHKEFLLSQYSQASTWKHVKVILFHSRSTSMNNTFKIYNDDDGSLIKEFKNIDHNQRRTSDYALYNQYRRLYTTGTGNLLYLVNDYTKRLIDRVSDEAQ